MKRSPLLRKSPLRATSTLQRRSTPARKPISPASPAQRVRVAGRVCVNCGSSPCDPAHLTPRSLGGCDAPECVVALCRGCHRAFDHGEVDLEPVLALREFSEERAHMAGHLSLRQCIKRLNGWKP